MKRFAIAIVLVAVAIGLARAQCPHVTYASSTKSTVASVPSVLGISSSLTVSYAFDRAHAFFQFSSLNLAAGIVVNIPVGQTYLYDLASSPQLGGIHVFGRLVFDDTKDIALDTGMVTVHDGAEFLIGSCDCPFEHKAIITLYGADSLNDPDGIGTKVIGAVGTGKVLIHGKVRGPTWTHLAATVNPGDTTFTLVEPVDWLAGDFIAFSPTDFPGYQPDSDPTSWQDGSENMTIASVSADKKTITVASPFVYGHYSGSTHGIETRGEVGLLTRNIVVKGDDSSLTSEFGGHFMFIEQSQGVLSGVEVTRGGQKRHLGRYPIHFHRMDDAPGCAVIDCSVHNNFQRAITIHGTFIIKEIPTNKVVIKRNVGYRTFGHMMFLEDGIERDNIIEWNLFMVVFQIQTADQLPGISSDDQPAVIWITNPANTFRSNVAAGSPHHCIWFALPINPTGPSHTRALIPRWTPLQEFSHNTAHSCGEDGMHIDEGPNQAGVPGGTDPSSITQYISTSSNGDTNTITIGAAYTPVSDPTQSALQNYDTYQALTPVPAIFESFTAWKCRNRGVWVRASYTNFTHNKFADSAIGITFATNGGVGGLSDSIFVGQTDNFGTVGSYEQSIGAYDLINDNPNPPFRSVPVDYPPISQIPNGSLLGPYFPIRGYEFYDGPNEIKNIQFWNYIPNSRRNASCISMLRDDQFSISASNRGSQVTVTDGSQMIYFPDLSHDGDKASVFLDMDGSITGRRPVDEDLAVVTHQLPILWTSSCIDNPIYQAYFCPNHFAGFSMNYNSPVTYPSNLATLDGLAEIRRSDTINTPLYLCGGPCNGGTEVVEVLQQQTSFFATLPLWHDYFYHFKTSAPASFTAHIGNHRHSLYKNNSAPYFEMRMAFCYPQGSTVKGVTWNWKSQVQPAASYVDMMARPYNYTWEGLGDGMYFWDADAGYLWLRFIIRDTQVDTPIGGGDGSWIIVEMNLGGGAMSCVPTPDGPFTDTYRTVPPIAAADPAPAFSAEAALIPRDDTNACAPVNPDCLVSAWTTFGPCTSPDVCSNTTSITGTQSRSRTVTQQPSAGGAACPSLSDTRNCSIPTCGTVVNCVMSDWADSSSHCKTCSGTVDQVRSILTYPLGGGTPCGSTTRVAPCSAVKSGCTSGATGLRFADVTAFLAFVATIFALF